MNKRIEQKIKKIYESVFNKVFKEAKKRNSLYKYDDINKVILKFQKSLKFKEFCRKFSVELAKIGVNQEKGLWKQYYNSAKQSKVKVLPSNFTEFQKMSFKKAILHNFRMIKSIPEEVKDVYKYKYIKTLTSQVITGTVGRGTFEKVLKESGSIKAKLIARTETAKLQTAITEDKAKDLGSICYKWRSSNDKRTRKSHREMNNVIVFWRKDSEKPLLDNMRGNAGEFPNCRCDIRLIFNEDDLTESMYQVYDYRTDRIVNMTKQQLLNCIKNKGLV